MEIVCPGCGKRGRIAEARPGMVLSCPGCRHRWTLDVPPPPRAAARPAAPAGEPTPSEAPRTGRAFLICALALLAGLALPNVLFTPTLDGGTTFTATWLWQLWPTLADGARVGVEVFAALAVLIGIVSLGRPSPLRAGLAGGAAAGIVLLHAIRESSGISIGPTAETGIGFPRVLLAIGAASAVLAAANRVLRRRADSGLARLVALAASVAGLALALLAPASADATGAGLAPGRILFRVESWRDAAPLAAATGLVLLHLASGLLHAFPGRGSARARFISVLGWIAAAGVPVGLAALPLWQGGPEAGRNALVFAAAALRTPGLLVLPALAAFGFALAYFGERIGRPAASAVERRSSSAPPLPTPRPAAPPAEAARGGAGLRDRLPAEGTGHDPELAELRRRLARLNAAHEEGLLTEDEYRVRRKEIIDRFPF